MSSKSGGTTETWSLYQYFYDKMGGNSQHFVAITDSGSDLDHEAQEKGFADLFLNPADIGGRYSALSYFGLVPAALIGVDLKKLWSSAKRMMAACGSTINATDHPGMWLGAIMGSLAADGQDKVTIQTSPSIASFGSWIEQLIAESTGKEGRGLLPVVGATVGMPHDYSTDRLFVYLRVEGDDNAEVDAGITTLQQAGQPCVTIHLDDTYALGGEFFRWEYATAIAGKILNVNPFDEPNVTESKSNTSKLLDTYQADGHSAADAPADRRGGRQPVRRRAHGEDALRPLLAASISAQYHERADRRAVERQPGGRLFRAAGLSARDREEVDAKLEEIRRRLRHVTRRAITLGYGPRYLHSTGQLHKGGPNNGIFIQITANHPADISIPNAPYTFGVLESGPGGRRSRSAASQRAARAAPAHRRRRDRRAAKAARRD